MRYTKPALTFEQQAQRLIDRGLIVPDKAIVMEQLSFINYYRLSAYWYPFRKIDPQTQVEKFIPGTKFETIWRRYIFDRRLRLIVMDAIERVEVAILRTRMVEQFTLLHGPFGYTNVSNFNPTMRPDTHQKLLAELADLVGRSGEDFVQRFRQKYTEENWLPLWMAAEIMSFGQLFTMFRNLHRAEQQTLAGQFDLYPPVLESWLHTLNFIRNVCAHHSRLLNRELSISPKLPNQRHKPEWHIPIPISNDRVFVVLTLLRYLMLRIAPNSSWTQQVLQLLNNYPEIPLESMGFPADWQSSPLWKV